MRTGHKAAISPSSPGSLKAGLLWLATLTGLLICFSMSSFADENAPLTITRNLHHTNLAPFINYYRDPSGTLALADIRTIADESKFLPLHKKLIQFGYDNAHIWARVVVHNPDDEAIPLVLGLEYPTLDYIDFYFPDTSGAYQHVAVGDRLAFASRPLDHRFFSIPFTVQPGTQTLYIEVHSDSFMYSPISLSSPENYLLDINKSSRNLGLFYGTIFSYLMLLFLLYVQAKERIYFYAMVTVGTGVLGLFHIDGYSHMILRDWHWWGEYSIYFYIYGCIAALSLLYMEYTRDSGRHPWQSLVLKAAVALSVLGIVSAPLLPHAISGPVNALWMIIAPLLFLAVSVTPVKPFDKEHYLIIVVISLLLFGSLWGGIASLFNDIDITTAITISRTAFVGQIVALTLLLARRYSRLTARSMEAMARAQDVERRGHEKDRFLAAMSHEIRTPLNGVLGMVEILSHTRIDEEQKHYLEIIKESGIGLMQIINDILDFSKIGAGQVRLKMVPFNLEELTNSCVQLVYPTTIAKELRIKQDIAKGLPVTYYGDPSRLRQVLLNLLSNAIKFTENGQIDIAVSAASPPANDLLTLKFSVADSGIGIKRKDLKYLFSEFQQLDTSTTRQHGGTGLGLSISKGLVELMGGEIGVQSKPGDGSCFWFTVTLKFIGEETTSEHRPTNAPDTSIAGLRVLVAEDNHVNRLVIQGYLKQLGVAADYAENGRHALHLVKSYYDRYDMILMDCEMPEMDGYGATTEIRRYEKQQGLSEKPIIAVSAHVINNFRERALEAGMNSYLFKPLDRNKLLVTMRLYAPPELIRGAKNRDLPDS